MNKPFQLTPEDAKLLLHFFDCHGDSYISNHPEKKRRLVAAILKLEAVADQRQKTSAA